MTDETATPGPSSDQTRCGCLCHSSAYMHVGACCYQTPTPAGAPDREAGERQEPPLHVCACGCDCNALIDEVERLRAALEEAHESVKTLGVQALQLVRERGRAEASLAQVEQDRDLAETQATKIADGLHIWREQCVEVERERDEARQALAGLRARIGGFADSLAEQGDDHVAGCMGQADCAACVQHDLRNLLDGA